MKIIAKNTADIMSKARLIFCSTVVEIGWVIGVGAVLGETPVKVRQAGPSRADSTGERPRVPCSGQAQASDLKRHKGPPDPKDSCHER